MGSITMIDSHTKEEIMSAKTRRTTAVNFVKKEPGSDYWELEN